MQFSGKSLAFAKRILKHYPLSQQNHSCQHKCEHHQPNTHQPFQHMHDHRKQREIYEKPTNEKIQNMRYFKQMGNNSFKEKKLEEAAYFYQKVIIYSDYTFPQDPDQIAQMDLLIQQANMNLAICLIKQNNWTAALVNLSQASKTQYTQANQKHKKSVLNTRKKAYYWLTKYYIRQAKYEKAKTQIQLLQEMPIQCKDQVNELKRQYNDEVNKYDKQTENLSKKMFALRS